MKKISLSIVIPTYNNEETIEKVVRQSDTIARSLASPYEILVINDGSVDGTARVLTDLTHTIKNLRVMTHVDNQGYGATIKELYYAARNDWIFSVPGDFQIRPQEIKKLIVHIDRADMILGKRTKRQDPASRLFESTVYNRLLRVLFHLYVTDVNSVRLMKTNIMKHVDLRFSSAFVDGELAVKAQSYGFRILEVPIDHQKQKSRGSGGRLTTILPTVIDMIRLWLTR